MGPRLLQALRAVFARYQRSGPRKSGFRPNAAIPAGLSTKTLNLLEKPGKKGLHECVAGLGHLFARGGEDALVDPAQLDQVFPVSGIVSRIRRTAGDVHMGIVQAGPHLAGKEKGPGPRPRRRWHLVCPRRREPGPRWFPARDCCGTDGTGCSGGCFLSGRPPGKAHGGWARPFARPGLHGKRCPGTCPGCFCRYREDRRPCEARSCQPLRRGRSARRA